MSTLVERQFRTAGDGLRYELVDGEWVRACEEPCGWGHLHRTKSVAAACADHYRQRALAQGWTPPKAPQ